jgi:hypothetical protein
MSFGENTMNRKQTKALKKLIRQTRVRIDRNIQVERKRIKDERFLEAYGGTPVGRFKSADYADLELRSMVALHGKIVSAGVITGRFKK